MTILEYNYQFPDEMPHVIEEFEIVLTGKGFLILKNRDGYNIKVRCPDSKPYSIKEKIYKEEGQFLWK